MFYDTIHLFKNIRNNSPNKKKFVFPGFDFSIGELNISSAPGYISWSDFHVLLNRDKDLPGNLRKAPKLSFKALYPGNNKQNLDLVISIFHESTIAAFKSYMPERSDISSFLNLILSWWTIANSRARFTPNILSNAVTMGDHKVDFYLSFANWLESWSTVSDFCLTKQTIKALIRTLRSQAMLIKELLSEDYEYILTHRLQSDP